MAYIIGFIIGIVFCIVVEVTLLWLVVITEDCQHRKFYEQEKEYDYDT